MTSFLRLLLALASALFLSLIVACNGGGNLLNDDDDATASDDDDSTTDGPEMSVVTITAPLHGVNVTLTRSDGERTTLECQTTCVTALEAGSYDGTCEMEGAICFPFQIEVAGGQPAGHSLDIGYVHNGTYTRYVEDCDHAATEASTFEISTEQGVNEVLVRGIPGGNYISEGDRMTSVADPSAYAITMEPNGKFELHGTNVRCFIRE